MTAKVLFRRYWKLVVIITVILLFGIFLGKNWITIPVWFFGWTLDLPLLSIALFCFIVGFICGCIGAVFYRRKQLEE